MSSILCRMLERLFIRMFSVAIARLEVGLDLALAESHQELLDALKRGEVNESGEPVATHLRLALVRLSQNSGIECSPSVECAPDSNPASKRKPESQAPAKGGKRGRPRKSAVAAETGLVSAALPFSEGP